MRFVSTLAALLLASSAALAQESQPATAPATIPATTPATSPAATAPDPRQALLRVMELQKEMDKHFSAKDYPAAEAACREILKVMPNSHEILYNLACAQARQDKKDAALKSLGSAVENGLGAGRGELKNLADDEDLAPLRTDKSFDQLLATAKVNQRAGGRYDKGAPIAGVKTVEDFPDGGLRYRLRMSPDATAEKPNKLIVWLHPSGGSANRLVEAMSPQLIRQGYAVLVCSQKQFMGWTPAEGEALITKTLPAVAKVPGIDARKPLLMGYSAGGQMALELWYDAPDRFGGLILDAAYPVDLQNRRYVLHDLPKEDKAIQKTPIFVLVGQKDGGAAFWKSAAAKWIPAGVPLTVHTIPDQGHAWLFGKAQVEQLTTWLGDVNAGKLPSDPAP